MKLRRLNFDLLFDSLQIKTQVIKYQDQPQIESHTKESKK